MKGGRTFGTGALAKGVAACLTVGLFMAAGAEVSEISRLTADGNTALSQKKYALAALKFGRALKLSPQSQDARAGMNTTVNRAAAIALNNPQESMIVFHRAIYMAQDHRAGELLEATIKSKGMNPASPLDRIELGRQARTQGDFEGTIVEYIAALSITDLPNIRLELAEALRAGNLVAPAIEQYKKVLEHHSISYDQKVKSWMGIGQCFETLHERTAAEDAYREAAAANREWRQEIRQKAGWTDEADKDSGITSRPATRTGQAATGGKRHGERISAVERDEHMVDPLTGVRFPSVKKPPAAANANSVSGPSPTATGKSRGGDAPTGGEVLSARRDILVNDGVDFHLEKQYDRAIERYLMALDIDPQNPDILTNIGASHQQKGDAEKARHYYLEALKHSKEHAGAHMGLKSLGGARLSDPGDLFKAGRFEEAAREYQSMVAKNPTNADYHFNLGTCFEALKKWDEAVSEYRSASNLAPANKNYRACLEAALARKADPVIAQATDRHKAGDLPEAIKLYVQALGLVPGNDAVLFNLAAAYFTRFQYPEAERTFGKISKEGRRKHPDTLWYLARLCENQNDGAQALALYKEYLAASNQPDHAAETKERIAVLEKDPNDTVRLRTDSESTKIATADKKFNEAVALQKAGRFDEAIACYKATTGMVPDEAEYWFALGTACQSANKLDDAIAAFSRSIELTPKDSYTRALAQAQTLKASPLIAKALASQTEGTPEALSAAAGQWLKVIEVCDLPTARVNLGKTYQALSRFADAAASYKKAISLDPELSEAHYLLGTVYESTREPKLAAAEYSFYVKQKPYGEHAAACLARLKALSIKQARP